MDSPNFEELESGAACEGISKSAVPKYIDPDMMERIYTCLCDKKVTLRNSSKLKGYIHSQINELIEVLKERERQLELEIDETNLDQCEAIRLIAELCTFADNESCLSDSPSGKHSTFSEDQESEKVHSTTFINSKMEFISNFEQVKTLLQSFGQIKKVEQTNDSDEDSFENVLSDQLPDEQASEASCSVDFGEQLKECLARSRAERSRKESSGSVDSFEVIDPCDDEFHQFTEGCKVQEGAVAAAPCSDSSKAAVLENQVLTSTNASAAAPDNQQRLKWKSHWVIDSKRLREVLNHKRKKKSKSKPQWPPADCRIMPPLDPTKKLRKQLYEMSVAAKPSQDDAKHKATADHLKEDPKIATEPVIKAKPVINSQVPSCLNNQSSSVKIESRECKSKAKPVPSAIIQETFEKFLVPNNPDKWLASPAKSFQPAVKVDSHLFNAKRLHFQVQ